MVGEKQGKRKAKRGKSSSVQKVKDTSGRVVRCLINFVYSPPFLGGWLRGGYTATERNSYDARKMLGGLMNEGE